MENTFKPENNIEEISRRIDGLVKTAKENAVIEEEFDSGNISKDKLALASVVVHTLPEFKILLSKLRISSQYALDILEHENAHVNKAEVIEDREGGVGFAGYKILFAKNGDTSTFVPSVSISKSDGLTPEEFKKIDREIASAPEEYGSYLSDRDKENLSK